MTYISRRGDIEAFEKSVVRGDLPAMARLIARLHEDWDSVPAHEQRDIMELEAAFLVMIGMQAHGNA